MSISGNGCEKCNYTGRVTTMFPEMPGLAPASPMQSPCGACSEPWGPRWLDAPDGPGWWWMLLAGEAPEAVRVEVFDTSIGLHVEVNTTRGTFGMPDTLASGAKWLRITPPTEPPR